MKQVSIFLFASLLTVCSFANTIVVKNINELNAANKAATPGDIIVLENGDWNDVSIVLDCKGTKEQPVTFRARTAGQVNIKGNSRLRLGGSYIIVDGLNFVKGYSGKDDVIDFKINKDKLANHCRVTNCSIDGFNNPKRMDENNWVSFSGKNNRLDHCSFVDKKNMGVLLAVLLDDDRSRENSHSIDHNYFGRRPPLASNGGEIIRVGVSQHCQFNSNTIIEDNYFEECDGETEIISIKSGGNIIRGNLFKECQGAVVLRHGDNNTVVNNVFLGNGKVGTGGVRVINRGQWVVNNLFHRLRGTDFRSPLSIMNGVPNSPANRYVQVTEAVIANNSFYECTPISFAEGSDKERSMAPDNVYFFHNVFMNSTDSLVYNAYDNISGIRFKGNMVSMQVKQDVDSGFYKTAISAQKADNTPFPYIQSKIVQRFYDSLQRVAVQRLGKPLAQSHGFKDLSLFKLIKHNSSSAVTGAPWKNRSSSIQESPVVAADCETTDEVYASLQNKHIDVIVLKSGDYNFDKPIIIDRPIQIIGSEKSSIRFASAAMPTLFTIAGNGDLHLEELNIDGSGIRAKYFIASDTTGWSDHYALSITKSTFKNFSRDNGCEDFFHANKSMVANSIIIFDNTFENNRINFFSMRDEKDDRGYYNAERIAISFNTFTSLEGFALNIYRGGNDESTLGPNLLFSANSFKDCNTYQEGPFIELTGVQKTQVHQNSFNNCVPGKKLIVYRDIVRAKHFFSDNTFTSSGGVETNKFVSTALVK